MLEKLLKEKEPVRYINLAFKSSVLDKLAEIATAQGYDSRKELLEAVFDQLVKEYEECQK